MNEPCRQSMCGWHARLCVGPWQGPFSGWLIMFGMLTGLARTLLGVCSLVCQCCLSRALPGGSVLHAQVHRLWARASALSCVAFRRLCLYS